MELGDLLKENVTKVLQFSHFTIIILMSIDQFYL